MGQLLDQCAYSAVPGSRFSDGDAQIIGPFIDNLILQLGRKITTEEILSAASPDDSPIHPYFEWDDTEAARQHRLAQARYLARSYRITINEVESQALFPVRGTINVVAAGEPERVYVPIQDTVTNPAFLAQVIERAGQHLTSWYTTYQYYRHIPEFAERFAPIFAILEARDED